MTDRKKARVPTLAAIERSIRLGLARELEGHLDNGSEFLFDLVNWDDLTPEQREVYQRKIEATVEKVAGRLRKGLT